MSSTTKRLLAGFLSALVVGCSGGGGDGNSAANAPLAEINSGNAKVVAGAVMQTAFDGGGLGAFAGSSSGLTLSDPGSRLFATLGQIQKSQTESLASKARSGVLQDTIPPEMQACAISGTVTVSGQVANPLTLSPTDTFTMVFSACDDGAGVVDGTYSMQVTGFGGDLLSGSFSLNATVTLTGFQVNDADGLVTGSGSLSIGLDYTAAPTLAITVTTTSLTVSDGTASQTLSSFSMTQSIDELTAAFSMTVSGSLTSTAFEGRVTFSTAATLLSDGTGYAYTGEVTISGASGATIDVIVLDGALVQLVIDLDGDNVPEDLIDTTWAELI